VEIEIEIEQKLQARRGHRDLTEKGAGQESGQG